MAVEVEAVVVGFVVGSFFIRKRCVEPVVVGAREEGDLFADRVDGVKSTKARGRPGFEMWEKLLEDVESLQDSPTFVTAQVKDELGFAIALGEAEKFLRGSLKVNLRKRTVNIDEVGDAEGGYLVVI